MSSYKSMSKDAMMVSTNKSLLSFGGYSVSHFTDGHFVGISWQNQWDTTAQHVSGAFDGLLYKLSVLSGRCMDIVQRYGQSIGVDYTQNTMGGYYWSGQTKAVD